MQAAPPPSWPLLVMTCLPGLSCFLTQLQVLMRAHAPIAGRELETSTCSRRGVGRWRAGGSRRDRRPSGLESGYSRTWPGVTIEGKIPKDQRPTVAGSHLTAMAVRKVRRSVAYERARRTGRSVGDGATPRGVEGRNWVTFPG